MPAKSQAQQQAMAIEYARRKKGRPARRFSSMSVAQLHEYAKTKRKGLPKRAKRGRKS